MSNEWSQFDPDDYTPEALEMMKVLTSIDGRLLRANDGNCDGNNEWILLLYSEKFGNSQLADVVPLLKVPQRLQLTLQDNGVTDEGVEHLLPLKNIVKLVFGRNFGNATAPFLGQLPALEEVWFLKSKLTDDAVLRIGALKGLRRLGLQCRSITDEGISHLTKLKRLWDLDLSGAKISDAGLLYLHGLRALRELTVSGKGITEAGLAALKSANRKVRVFRDP